jgi:hypothetical protein
VAVAALAAPEPASVGRTLELLERPDISDHRPVVHRHVTARRRQPIT